MKATGIVVEYNPFHNGHKYHLYKAKELNPNNIIVAVMSGDFVQRGEPSIIDRWTKTEMALKNGVDMVVELPSFYSTQSAEIFAKGAIGILNELGCENIIFGSESGDIEALKKISTLQESVEFKKKLKERLKEGYSYPTAHGQTMKEILNGSELNSNDILGLEYIKAIRYWKSKIIPITLKREKVGYHDANIVGEFASATKIRSELKEKKAISDIVTKESLAIIEKYQNFTYIDSFFPFLKYELIKNYKNLSNIQDIEIGFENRLFESIITSNNYDEFFKKVSNRRYTTGRVQRVFLHILLNLSCDITEEVKKNIPYVKVLGFNSRGREYLSSIKKEENGYKIITSYKKMNEIFSKEVCRLIEFNERASSIYRLINNYKDYKSPIILKEEEHE